MGTYAKSSVDRSLAGRSFTIDLMAKVNKAEMATTNSRTLFGHGSLLNANDGYLGMELMPSYFWTGDETDNTYHLYFYTNEGNCISQPLTAFHPETSLTRMGVICSQEDGTSMMNVKFFADKDIIEVDTALSHRIYYGKQWVKAADGANLPTYMGYGPVRLGNTPGAEDKVASFNGNITEVRLWNKALTRAEVTSTYNKRVNGFNKDLIAYWPLNEGQGNVAEDLVNGATLDIQGATWQVHKGYSLKADHRAVRLNAQEGNEITFALQRDGESQTAATRLRYDSQRVAGSLDLPCVISMTEEETIGQESEGDIYSIQGYKVGRKKNLSRGIYITNNKKVVKK